MIYDSCCNFFYRAKKQQQHGEQHKMMMVLFCRAYFIIFSCNLDSKFTSDGYSYLASQEQEVNSSSLRNVCGWEAGVGGCLTRDVLLKKSNCDTIIQKWFLYVRPTKALFLSPGTVSQSLSPWSSLLRYFMAIQQPHHHNHPTIDSHIIYVINAALQPASHRQTGIQ